MITIAITQAKMGLSMKKLTKARSYEAGLGVGADAAAGAAAGTADSSSSGFTVEPGFANCKPSTMTRSPALTPSVTSHASPIARSVTSERSSTLLSALTTSVVGRLSGCE